MLRSSGSADDLPKQPRAPENLVTATIEARIARELDVREEQVEKTISLIDEGSTVPFIARYRKEVTGGLDDIQLRSLEERRAYLRELEARRATVIASIVEQGKMTGSLQAAIDGAAQGAVGGSSRGTQGGAGPHMADAREARRRRQA